MQCSTDVINILLLNKVHGKQLLSPYCTGDMLGAVKFEVRQITRPRRQRYCAIGNMLNTNIGLQRPNVICARIQTYLSCRL
jgi:hypothetical protein